MFITEKLFSIPNQPVTWMQYVSGVVVVLGHSFPVWLKFKGGKGGATCIGVLAEMIPWAAPFYLGLFLLLTFLTCFPTLSYGVAFVTFPIVAGVVYHQLALVAYSIAILLIPGILYIPRIREMYRKGGGSWRRVIKRRNLQEGFENHRSLSAVENRSSRMKEMNRDEHL